MSKFCGHCGSSLADNATFCPNCGAPAVDQAAPQQQFSQPQQFNQPAFSGAPAMGAAKPGMSKGAKMGIIIACGAVALGLIIWLIVSLVGGGYEKPIKNYVAGLENQDVDKFVDSITSSLTGTSASSARNTYTSKLKSMISRYGSDFKISYDIIDKVHLGKESTLGIYDDAYSLTIEFKISGSIKDNVVTKTVTVFKYDGKWFLNSSFNLW